MKSKIIFEDGTHVDITESKKRYYSYKRNVLTLYKSVKELILCGDVLCGDYKEVISTDDIKVDNIVLNNMTGTLNTEKITVSNINICSTTKENPFILISKDLNKLEVYENVTYTKVILKSLIDLVNRGAITTLEIQDVNNLISKHLGKIHNYDFCKLDKLGNVIYLHNDEYIDIQNKLHKFLNSVNIKTDIIKIDSDFQREPSMLSMVQYRILRDKEILNFYNSLTESSELIDILKKEAEINYRYNKLMTYINKKVMEKFYNSL